MLLNRSVRWCFLALSVSLAACAGGDDDDGGDRDAGVATTRDGGDSTTRDAGEDTTDSGVRDAGEDRDGGPRDSGVIDPVSEPYRTRRNSGDPANRIDIVIVSEGYTLEELTTRFEDDVGDAIGRTFNRRGVRNNSTEPFRTYRDYFNVHQVHLASNESGIDVPGTMVDTALDAQALPCGGGVGGMANCPIDFGKAEAAIDAALAGSGITPDIKIVMLNTDTNEARSYFPPQGPYIVLGARFMDSIRRSENFMREIAVAWAGLAYETTDDPGGAFPGGELAPNTSTSAAGAWPEWDGHNEGMLNNEADGELNPIGAYEGGAGFATGIYRPSMNSKLGTYMPGPFNAVSRQQIVRRILESVEAIEDHTDNSMRLVDPNAIYLTLFGNSPVRWTFDGTVIDGLTDPTFGPVAYAQLEGIGPGVYEVTATVERQSNWVRTPLEALTSSVAWEIELTP